jgi:hypothetical protein
MRGTQSKCGRTFFAAAGASQVKADKHMTIIPTLPGHIGVAIPEANFDI